MVRQDGELMLQRLVKAPKHLEQPPIIVDVEGRATDIQPTLQSPMCQAGGLMKSLRENVCLDHVVLRHRQSGGIFMKGDILYQFPPLKRAGQIPSLK
jgi:hypothetical protein